MSAPESLLELHLRAEKIAYTREYRAIPNRKFSYDFRCYGYRKSATVVVHANEVLVEVQGGAWMKPILGKDGKYHSRGAHGTGASQERDCEKSSLATIHGYRLLHVTPAQIKSGLAISWIKQALQ